MKETSSANLKRFCLIAAAIIGALAAIAPPGSASEIIHQLIEVRCSAGASRAACDLIEQELIKLWGEPRTLTPASNSRVVYFHPMADAAKLMSERSIKTLHKFIVDVQPNLSDGRWNFNATNWLREGRTWRRVSNAGNFRIPSEYEVEQGTHAVSLAAFAHRVADFVEVLAFK